MKTKLKLLLVLLATFCVTLTCAIIAACNPEDQGNGPNDIDYGDPATDGYQITLLFPDGTPVTNKDGDSQFDIPSIELTDEDGNIVDQNAYSEVNASGVAQISYYVPGEYYIKVTDYPSGYMFDNKAIKTSADRAFYTVSLFPAAPTSYRVTVNYPNGDHMAGITVKFMSDNTTVATATTDESGTASTPALERNTYNIVLENLPEGYIYKTATTSISGAPVTITTYAATAVMFDDEHKLDENGVKVWDDALNSYTGISIIRFNTNADCYQYNATFAANQEVFFTLKAPKEGEYIIASKKNNDYVIQFYSNDLSYVDNSLTISSAINNGNNVRYMHINENETLTFSVKSYSREAGTVEVLICMPVPAAKTITAVEQGEYNLTFDEFPVSILNFKTSTIPGQGFGQGVYRISSDSANYDVMIVEYVNSFPSLDETSDLTGEYEGFAGNDNGKGDGLNFVFDLEFSQSYIGATVELRIIIKDENFSGTTQIKIKIERLGDAEEEKPITVNPVTTNVTEKYADPQAGSTFTWMPTDGSVVPYSRDGKWYVNVNGEEKPLVVAITKNFEDWDFSFSNVEYFNEDGTLSSTPVRAHLTVADGNDQYLAWNYRDFIAKYATLVNSDGVYEVNDELHTFLERYMNQRYTDLTASTVRPAYPWLLGCGYYTTPDSGSADATD